MLFKSSWLLALAPLVQNVLGQNPDSVPYTDPDSGIEFGAWTNPRNTMKIGFSFPANALTVDAKDYIGVLECATPDARAEGWCAISLGGSMNTKLLVVAYPNGDEVITDLKWATGYANPLPYTGNAEISQISSSVNATHFRVVYKCQNCLTWSQDGSSGALLTTASYYYLGWAHGTSAPANGACADNTVLAQHDTFGLWGGTPGANLNHAEFSTWWSTPSEVKEGNCGGTPTSTTSSSIPSSTAPPVGSGTPVPTGTAYDYIIVGSGAGGIPIADKLSEGGKKVLLIEKGPASSGRYNGKLKPEWLEGTNLTRFDVPGLCNQIWKDATGVACRDTDQMAGCVLGGGVAVNAGLWWKPNPVDWDYNFPSGWKSSDVKAATDRVFSRIAGTTVPSVDGKKYYQEGFNVLSNGLKSGGWQATEHNSSPGSKNRTYGAGPFMFSGGERGGPLATYLSTATKRNNFQLWTNTQVNRVVRNGGHVTGVEVENYNSDGYRGTVNLSATGRVILAAGTFGSPKILYRSGIGPKAQIDNVKNSTEGKTLIDSKQWIINNAVGSNLEDHTNTDIVISHPDVVHYDFYKAWDSPIPADKDAYLKKRSGILAQAAPNIGPLFFDEVRGADNIVRSIQYTARVEGNANVPDGKAMVISQYLGRGAVSRGKMAITTSLNTVVSEIPYLRDNNDREAIIKSLENLQKTLVKVPGLKIEWPANGTTMREHVETMIVATGNRRANHWIGTNKIGTKDGRLTGGDSVVDLNTKVYGTDNLFVVDASIFPGMVTTNPSAYIVIASEHAAAKINALTPAAPAAKYAQCGGKEHTGSFHCASGSTCSFQNDYYSQCL
jgi:cellobiose dehydrogenase (acceptor)